MRVWLVCDLDPLPIDAANRKHMRSAHLGAALADAGHATTWITSNFDHYRQVLRLTSGDPVAISDRLSVVMLAGRGYPLNARFQRILHDRQFARAFRRYASVQAELPDVILTDIPSTDAAAAAVAFGLSKSIPTVVSIRNQWPDSLMDRLPASLQPLAAFALAPFNRQVDFVSGNAASLIGVSSEYLEWGLRKAGRAARPSDAIFPLTYRRPSEAPATLVESQLEAWHIEPHHKLIAYAGSWGPVLDQQLLLDTADRLERRSDIVLGLGGDPVDPSIRDSLERRRNVRLLGRLNAQQIAILLDRSQIGLLPYMASAPSGLPSEFLKYMAHGCFQIATISGEIAEQYIRTGSGRTVSGASDAFAASIAQSLENAAAPTRDKIIGKFRHNYRDGEKMYGSFVRHIERVAGRVPLGPGAKVSSPQAVARTSSTGPRLSVNCRHLTAQIEETVRTWFRGDIEDFELDGDRSVRISHPLNPDQYIKIKGAGLSGGSIQFGRKHRSHLPAPVFDFEGRMMEDVASGHDNAVLGGASFQQSVAEFSMSKILGSLGYATIHTLGYGSVALGERVSWFSVYEWPRNAVSMAPPTIGIEAFAEANIAYGAQALELAIEHRLIGYFWYASAGGGTRLMKDLHPFRRADPINMSRLSWVMQLLFSLNIVSLSTIHLAKRSVESVPNDLQVMVFRRPVTGGNMIGCHKGDPICTRRSNAAIARRPRQEPLRDRDHCNCIVDLRNQLFRCSSARIDDNYF